MATKSFAIPLDEDSKQTGDITFETLAKTSADVTFKITNVTAGAANDLNLITSKGGVTEDHKHTASVANGDATVTISHSIMVSIYNDANGGDWDYIEAKWTVGSVNVSGSSNNYEIQGGRTYDGNGWPPA